MSGLSLFNGEFLLLRNFGVAISVSLHVCFILVLIDFYVSKARFHVGVRTQINKFVFYFIVRRNVKFGCFEC